MCSNRVIIIGYGFTGQAIDRKLSEEGFETVGVRRNWKDNKDENLHSQPIEADITEPESLEKLPEDPCAIINCVSSGKRGDVERYRSVYYQGARNLLDWAERNLPERIVWTGSSAVYGQSNGQWVDETSETEPGGETGRVLLETESLYREARNDLDLDTVILRLTGIYGPGRTRALSRVRDGDVTLNLAEADRYLNMIHRDDIGRAVTKLLKSDIGNETFNLTDNEPVTRRRLYFWLSQRLDQPLPKIVAEESLRPSTNKRVRNEKIKDQLNLSFQYPTYREGYTQTLKERGLLN